MKLIRKSFSKPKNVYDALINAKVGEIFDTYITSEDGGKTCTIYCGVAINIVPGLNPYEIVLYNSEDSSNGSTFNGIIVNATKPKDITNAINSIISES